LKEGRKELLGRYTVNNFTIVTRVMVYSKIAEFHPLSSWQGLLGLHLED
jgi:hypothetical protein